MKMTSSNIGSIIAFVIALSSVKVDAQNNLNNKGGGHGISIPLPNGDFFCDVSGWALNMSTASSFMNSLLGLAHEHTFTLLQEQKDNLGMHHLSYQQYYKGIPVEEGMVLIHGKREIVSTMNGHVVALPDDFSVVPKISEHEAINCALSQLGITPLTHPSAQLVIGKHWTGDIEHVVLAYKIYVEGKSGLNDVYLKKNVFVDAQERKVTHAIDLIYEAVVPATAHTLFNGVREINTASDKDSFVLFDSIRNIRTYDFSNAKRMHNGGFDNVLDFFNASDVWDVTPALDSVTLLIASDTTLFPSQGRWIPYMYIVADTNAIFPIQGPIYDYKRPRAAPANFNNVGLNLITPPYTVIIRSVSLINNQNSGQASFTISASGLSEGTHSWSDAAGNSGTYTIKMKPNPAIDAHWGMAQTYDYFKETFQRNSFDNRGGAISNYVNAAYAFSGTQSQAMALGNGLMAFGLGDRKSMREFVALDIMGHEFSHMVVSANGNGGLVYQGESGALNESFADIFGTCIEFFTKQLEANWNIGEDVFVSKFGMFRSMSEPKSVSKIKQLAQPDTYEGYYWINPKDQYDQGGVHINSGIQNKWFHLLCEGGKGINDKENKYEVKGIGREKAEQIAYRNLMNYLTPYARYRDAYKGSLQAAADLYGINGTEYTVVKAAWYAVGLDDATEISPIVKYEDLSVYPNPASNHVQIFSHYKIPIPVTLFNLLGHQIQEITVGPGLNEIDIRGLSKGMYILYSNDGARTFFRKISVI